MTDRARLVSERLTDMEAAEAVRRLDAGGTGVRPGRQGIAATVKRLEDGAHGMAVLVKDSRNAEAARALLEDEGWPVYRPVYRAAVTTYGDPCRNCLATKDPADVCRTHRGMTRRPIKWWPEEARNGLSWHHRGQTRREAFGHG